MPEAVLYEAGAKADGGECVRWSSVGVWWEAVAVHVAVPPTVVGVLLPMFACG